jgi:hypothetical protein
MQGRRAPTVCVHNAKSALLLTMAVHDLQQGDVHT